MAPSSGHLLVPKAMKAVKVAFFKTTFFIRSKLPSQTTATTTLDASLQPIRIPVGRQSIHPVALLRQSRLQNQNRWFSSTSRTFASKPHQGNAFKYDRAPLPKSRTSNAIARRGAAPFASTLRPNLTGGALPRSAGGYSLGGGAQRVRHFSHTPAAPAQVLQNVNASLRAFLIGGGKARFDGVDPVTGEKKWRSVSAPEDHVSHNFETARALRFVTGTSLEFRLNPTITALAGPSFVDPKKVVFNNQTLGSMTILENLAMDFARAVKDLSAILADFHRLAALGDLPLSVTKNASGSILTVRFPGCDADTVSRLCDEVGVRRGVIKEDEEWQTDKGVDMALLFPFAPTGSADSDARKEYFSETKEVGDLRWDDMLSPSEHSSTRSKISGFTMSPVGEAFHHMEHTWAGTSGEYATSSEGNCNFDTPLSGDLKASMNAGVQDYEGVEGIYKFLQECDRARR